MLPQVVGLKSDDTTYLATDLSKVMVEMSKKNIGKYIQKLGVDGPVEEWMQKKKLEVRQTDGEEKIETPFKFDRIMANLILHIVPDPVKMLKNLW